MHIYELRNSHAIFPHQLSSNRKVLAIRFGSMMKKKTTTDGPYQLTRKALCVVCLNEILMKTFFEIKQIKTKNVDTILCQAVRLDRGETGRK